MKLKIALMLAVAAYPAVAGTQIVEAPRLLETPESSSAWWMTITPYGWVTATDGDMGVAGRVAPVDISFSDTLENLDLAFMLALECGFDRWVFGLDGLYGALSSSAGLPAIAAPYDRATINFDQFFGRVHAGYQVLADDSVTLTAFVGARYTYFSTDIDFTGGGVPTLSVDGSKGWFDPVIGMHGSWEINNRWFLHGGGDIGGFGVNSDLIWQANVGLGYRFTDSVSGLVGYRGIGVDYTDGGFVVDTISHGPIIGVSLKF